MGGGSRFPKVGSAGTIQLMVWLALTLSLGLKSRSIGTRRGNHLGPCPERSLKGEPLPRGNRFSLSQRERAGLSPAVAGFGRAGGVRENVFFN